MDSVAQSYRRILQLKLVRRDVIIALISMHTSKGARECASMFTTFFSTQCLLLTRTTAQLTEVCSVFILCI